jgi:ABC-type antimicrobial peptide transport system permease subunit
MITFPPNAVVAKPPVTVGFPMLLLVVIVLLVMLAIAVLGLLVSRRRMQRMEPMQAH